MVLWFLTRCWACGGGDWFSWGLIVVNVVFEVGLGLWIWLVFGLSGCVADCLGLPWCELI